MNKGDIKYYKFVESLGALKLCAVSASEAASIKDGAKIVMSDINFEYGTHTVEKYPMIKGYLKTSLLEACGQDLEMKNEIEKVL